MSGCNRSLNTTASTTAAIQTCPFAKGLSTIAKSCPVPTKRSGDISFFAEPSQKVVDRLEQAARDLKRRYQCRKKITWSEFSGTSLSEKSNRDTQKSHSYARVLLTEDDFQSGTLIIWAPCELIFDGTVYSVYPNPGNEGRPTNLQRAPGNLYSGPEYDLGFFAAIAVRAHDVTISLNGSTLEQSSLFALLQRFYAIVEGADQPFIPNQGPANFGSELDPANGLFIENGTLGRSSHHGLHGNGSKNVLLKNVTFQDYEVAAVSVNGVSNFAIVNSTAKGSRTDTPVAATFSAARFLLQFIDKALQETMSEAGVAAERANLIAVRAILAQQVQEAIDAVESNTPADIPAVFQLTNSHGLIDGNGYGFLFNVLGVAVNGFVQTLPLLEKASTNVVVKNSLIKDTAAAVDLVVALRDTTNGKIVVDPAGSVLQVLRITDQNGVYVGTSVSNAKIALGALYNASSILQADATFNGIYIPPAIVTWAQGQTESFEDLADFELVFGGDSMFHLNKGVFGINANGVFGLTLDNVEINKVSNFCVQAEFSNHPAETLSQVEFTGDDAFGISLSSCQSVRMKDVKVKDVVSECEGEAFGLCLRGETRKVVVFNSEVESTQIREFVESTRFCRVSSQPTVIEAPLEEINITTQCH